MAPVSFNPSIYPSCVAYVKSLPNGLESYPECGTSVAFLHEIDRQFPNLLQAETLPEPVRRLLRKPWPDGGWVPATTMVIATLLVRDVGTKSTAEYQKTCST